MTAEGSSASTLVAITSMTASATGVTTILFPVVVTSSASSISIMVAVASLFLLPVPPSPLGRLPSPPPSAVVSAAGAGVIVIIVFVRPHPVKSCARARCWGSSSSLPNGWWAKQLLALQTALWRDVRLQGCNSNKTCIFAPLILCRVRSKKTMSEVKTLVWSRMDVWKAGRYCVLVKEVEECAMEDGFLSPRSLRLQS